VKERTAELRALNERLEHLAITDPLTGLLNRRALFEAMRREMAREQRHSRALSLIVIDVDHFKRVNDRYGHAAGDAVLQRLAATASRTVRESDVVARYGGEEFVVLAPDTDEAQAVALAERIRSALASASVDVGGDTIRFTASFGVATMRDADREPQQVLQRADRALYAAKAAGRDRVVLEATA
jgi:diguanylate cyclase (GGDEF)-like protein